MKPNEYVVIKKKNGSNERDNNEPRRDPPKESEGQFEGPPPGAGGCLIGCLGVTGGASLGMLAASVIGFFSLGPLDAARTTYNALIGDTPVIREQAVEYVRTSLKKEFPYTYSREKLAQALDYDLAKGEQVNPQSIPMSKLWDAVEDHSHNLYDRRVWARLSK